MEKDCGHPRPWREPEGFAASRLPVLLIIASLGLGTGALIAWNSCTSYQVGPPIRCIEYGYQPTALVLLLVAGVMLVAATTWLWSTRPAALSPQAMFCPVCGHSLAWYPETEAWRCARCGRTYRSAIDPGFYPRDLM